MNFYVLTVAAIIGLAVGVLVWWLTRSVIRGLLGAVGLIGLVAALLPWDAPSDVPTDVPSPTLPTLAMLEGSRPIEVPSDGYVTSDACRQCHPKNHASWHASYHRTMTQVAEPEAILGDFSDVHLTDRGRRYYLRQDQDVCWVEMADPTDSSPNAKQLTMPVVMTTGSHHMQAYWLGTGWGRTTDLLPFVFLNETQEWIPRSAAFLRTPEIDADFEFGRWSMICSQCHSTHRRERLQADRTWDTQVAEFGISCEACHGPAQEHIQYQRALAGTSAGSSPAGAEQREQREQLDQLEPSDPIVNPESLTHRRSAQVCGQCHSVRHMTEDLDQRNMAGHSFRPGDDLHATHEIWQRDSPRMVEALSTEHLRAQTENDLARTFYSDGMIRVSGREFNGLLDSACYQRGEMSCLSCHQLHKSESDSRSTTEWANDQLRSDALGDTACLQCHSVDRYGSGHTHHAIGSSGASCYNCHMPHTTYGLLKAIRNHTISSPNIGRDVAAKRPNACNLCHLDETLQWSADHLKKWYDIEPPELNKEQRDVAASLLWLLKGDAAQRALATWSMGWPEAQRTSGADWQAPFLARLLDDSYPAIRLIARRTLRTLPGLDDLRADPMGSKSERIAAAELVLDLWQSKRHAEKPSLLMQEGGLQIERIDQLLSQRDETPIDLAE